MKQTRGVGAPSTVEASRGASPKRATREALPLPASFDLKRIAIRRNEVAPSVVQRAVAEPGEPLPSTLRGQFASGLGSAVSQVRVHRGALATEATGALAAEAFTVGRHVVLDPQATDATLAHEVAHAAQQGFAEPGTNALAVAPDRGAAEHAAERAAGTLLAGGRPASLGTTPVQVARKPKALRITLVRVGVLPDDLIHVAQAATTALSSTTKASSDKRIAAGVTVGVTDLTGAAEARKRGDILVYVIDNAKTDDERDGAVRKVLAARGWATDGHNRSSKSDTLADDVSRISSQLREDRGLFDHTTGASLVDISDLPAKLSKANLRSIAGTALHEGVGHPAGLDHHGKSGVMSSDAPNEAAAADIVFDDADVTKVNKYLTERLDDPTWDLK